ncbi:YjjG family noncanonical pyrimidine nucleotidase [Elusimicrobiota bacterium]
MKYKLILFDADDTLLDFVKSEKVSFSILLKQYGIKRDLPAIFKTYRKISLDLWFKFERRQVTLEEIRVDRFAKTFKIHQIGLDANKVGKAFLDILAQNVFLIKDAKQICKKIKKFSKVGIITNGSKKVQKQRLAVSGLGKYIDFMVSSEECKYSKPHPNFFECALKRARMSDRSKVLIVGDRLDADIRGAQNFGIDSCWYNPDGLPNKTDATPNYEIKSLKQIFNILV